MVDYANPLYDYFISHYVDRCREYICAVCGESFAVYGPHDVNDYTFEAQYAFSQKSQRNLESIFQASQIAFLPNRLEK